ncbi:MAG: c-type cytochrome, partial [Isosphaeraceae bacterium]
DRLGCANCHAVLDLPKHPHLGPDLADAGRAIDPDWLGAWLVDPGSVRPNPRMPGHGLTQTDAADLAAFLAQGVKEKPLKDEIKMALNVADPVQGRTLFRTVGCLGCHTKGKTIEPPADRAAPDLTDLGRKRSATWLAAYLARPSPKAVGRHRPDMHLNADAAAHLAAYLVTEPPPAPPHLPASKGDAKRGRSLVESHRCASCHAIPGVKAQPADVPLGPKSDPLRGCLAVGVPGPRSPRYTLTADQRAALRSFVAALPANPSPTPSQVFAEDTVRRLNCLGCHSRDGIGGAWIGSQLAAYLARDSELGTWKGTLTPPNLTAVGDKLRPEALALAVRGQGPAARPWLSVHMPTYPFEDGEADAIVEYLRDHDRMSSEPDPPPKTKAPDPATINAAAALIGQRGFGCISCHVLAGKIPPGGEPETLGPDLSFAHQRMTERYFRRWIADPQRIIPGTSMPQFLMPAPNNPGTLEEQLATIWTLLGSDRVAEVASVGTRELLKRQGDRALVVRDMVILPDAPGKHTPRGLAIGLKNDQGLLFDTDRLAWVGWWRGGFLSRTKSGRLWEWHPEGPPLWTTTRRDAPIVFQDAQGAVHAPGEVRERFGSFSGLTFEGDGLSISYRLNGPGKSLVNVQEQFTPTELGWARLVRVDGVPAGYRPLIAERLGDRVASSDEGHSLHWTAGPSVVTLDSPSTSQRDQDDPASYQWPMTSEGDGAYSTRLNLTVTPAP